jgi:hypothetical protein
VPRSTYYDSPRPESAETLRRLRKLDQLYLDCPLFGSRTMAIQLKVNRKRAQRLMRMLGIEAHYPKSLAPASGTRRSDTGGSIRAQTQKEKVAFLMGTPSPNPWDLSLLFSRVDVFRFTRSGSCRTIDMLERRTGPRGDATRAPIQARSGWRPHGRLPISRFTI